MKLTVFGATGRIGGELVRQGLAAGHEVTAVVRDRARLVAEGQTLRTVEVPAIEDTPEIRSAVTGADAVLSALGPTGFSSVGAAERLTTALVSAMAATGSRRLLVVSAGIAGQTPPDDTFFVARVAMPTLRTLFRGFNADLKAMEAVLAASDLDWTVVRPPRLLNRPVTGRYRTSVDVNVRNARTLGRADAAHAMLAMADDPSTYRHAVSVAY